MTRSLSNRDTARWTAWKRASDAVERDVARRIATATGLSTADFAVLTRVVEIGDGALRQQRLADLLGWERSRLSRQLNRMEQRGLVTRRAQRAVQMVAVTDEGRAGVAAARPAHAAAVRDALLARVPVSHAAEFWSTIETIGRDPAN